MAQSNNPFETYPETFRSILRKRFVCPTLWKYDDKDIRADGEAEIHARKYEYWVNDECAAGACLFCLGRQHNEWFQEKPSDTEIDDWILKNQIKCELAKKAKRKRYNEILMGNEKNNGQLITLSLDQKYQQIPKLFADIIAEIRKADYEFLLGAFATLEVYGKDGNYNPHCHIITKKIKNPGVVTQAFRRKFIKDKWQCYRVHIRELPYEAGDIYCQGIKETSKQDAVAKDEKYRQDNNILSYYII